MLLWVFATLGRLKQFSNSSRTKNPSVQFSTTSNIPIYSIQNSGLLENYLGWLAKLSKGPFRLLRFCHDQQLAHSTLQIILKIPINRSRIAVIRNGVNDHLKCTYHRSYPRFKPQFVLLKTKRDQTRTVGVEGWRLDLSKCSVANPFVANVQSKPIIVTSKLKQKIFFNLRS